MTDMNTKPTYCLDASVLPAVMVLSVLLLLGVTGVLYMWETDSLFFARKSYIYRQRSYLESAFVLYANYPEVISSGDSAVLVMHDSLPDSEVVLRRKPWGLYEVVTGVSDHGRFHLSCIMGAGEPSGLGCNFWYMDSNSALTLSGKTELQGAVSVPKRGVAYGQLQSEFFSGRKIPESRLAVSTTEMPAVPDTLRRRIGAMLALTCLDSLSAAEDVCSNRFYDSAVRVVYAGSGTLEGGVLRGNVMMVCGNLELAADNSVDDILIVARTVEVKDGFRGSVQIFASDTVRVGDNVNLKYPSGVYAEKHISLGDSSEVNGYVVLPSDTVARKSPNYIQSRYAVVRGLLYVDGTAQLQGIVSGSVFLNKAMIYTPRGYYTHMINDVAVLENPFIAFPLWIGTAGSRKEAKWVK